MKKIKILIADDNKDFCNIVEEVLSYEDDIEFIGAAYDGEKAIEILKAEKVDILLLDIIMPILDGIGVLEKITEMNIKDMKVIILSSIGQERVTSYALSKGAEFYIMKPFDFQLFPKRIREIYYGSDNSKKILTIDDFHSDLDEYISNLLLNIGIMPHIKGYKYIKDSLHYAYADSTILNKVTKELYPKIAFQNNTTSSRVERAIRNSIEIASKYVKTSNYDEYSYIKALFKNKKPTNLEFIAGIYQEIKIKF